MSLRRAVFACLVTSFPPVNAPPLFAAPALPPGFARTPIGGSFVNPTSLEFLGPNRLLVTEKRGTVIYVENDVRKNVVIDLSLEALDNGDRGLLSVAADPDFANNGWLYFLLIVDPNQDGVEAEQFAFCRLVRYQASFQQNGDLLTNHATRQVLLGATWTTAIPSCHFSHAIGNLEFMSDGSLVLTAGDGAHYDAVDAGGLDAPCFGPGALSTDQNIGAFRSVYPFSYSGKVLRIDRNTGLGLPDNPQYDGNPDSIRSRIWASGLRNPYRFTKLPGTGPKEKLLISDVGWNDWEEIELCAGGENFGWPCFEGNAPQNAYLAADTAGHCSTVTHAPPLLAWHHSSNGALGFKGNCAAGIAVYSGTQFPPIYHGAVFYCDFGQSWMRTLRLDGNGQIVANQPFATLVGSPTSLEFDPATGELVLASLENGGMVQRIRYLGNTSLPQAVASATPTYGAAPLVVQFKGSESSTPLFGPLAYSWDFGDGTNSSLADPQKTYPLPGSFTATLTVTNSNGYFAESSVLVTPGNTPPTIVHVRNPQPGKKYVTGATIALDAKAVDLENALLGVPLDLSWHVDLVHEDHVHPDFAVVAGAHGSFVALAHGDASYYSCRFVAKDSFGLVTEKAVPIYDVATAPAIEVESISDTTPRLGTPVTIQAKMFYPGAVATGPLPSLSVDYGDGSLNVGYGSVMDHQIVTFQHEYAAIGVYTVTFRAAIGNKSSATTATIEVITPKPAIAVFTPLLAQKWIPWLAQQSLATDLAGFVGPLAGGTEVRSFSTLEQSGLVAWLTAYLDDGVRDVLVIADYAPASVFAGEIDGSLAEEWIEHGNGIIWTGYQPFYSYVDELGVVSSNSAGAFGGDQVLDAPLFALVTTGAGAQFATPLAAIDVPSLLAPYTAGKAFKYTKIGANYVVDKLYTDNFAAVSDAIAVRHVASGGFFAEFYCLNGDAPRAAVIGEFLRAYVTGP